MYKPFHWYSVTDLRHKFERQKKRKLTQEEKKVFVKLAREHICSCFGEGGGKRSDSADNTNLRGNDVETCVKDSVNSGNSRNYSSKVSYTIAREISIPGNEKMEKLNLESVSNKGNQQNNNEKHTVEKCETVRGANMGFSPGTRGKGDNNKQGEDGVSPLSALKFRKSQPLAQVKHLGKVSNMNSVDSSAKPFMEKLVNNLGFSPRSTNVPKAMSDEVCASSHILSRIMQTGEKEICQNITANTCISPDRNRGIQLDENSPTYCTNDVWLNAVESPVTKRGRGRGRGTRGGSRGRGTRGGRKRGAKTLEPVPRRDAKKGRFDVDNSQMAAADVTQVCSER